MVVEVRYKDKPKKKYIQVCCAGVLSSHPQSLYMQARHRNNVKEIFIPLSDIKSYIVRESVK